MGLAGVWSQGISKEAREVAQQGICNRDILKAYVAGVMDGDGVGNLITHLGDGRINRLGDINAGSGLEVTKVITTFYSNRS